MRTLLPSLSDHPMALLRGIAELRGVALASNARDEAAAQLAAALAEGGATEAALAACSEAARAAWAALSAAGGRSKAAPFARTHGALRPVGPGRLEREALWRQPGSPAEELWYRGLIYRAFADLGDGPAEVIYIPDELLPPGAQPAPSGRAALTLTLQPGQAGGGATVQAFNSLTIDLCAILAALREEPAAVGAEGVLQAGEAERLGGGLLLADPVRLELLLALGRGRGWLKADRGRLVLDVGAATAWLRATHWEQMSTLFAAWRDSVDAPPMAPGGDLAGGRAAPVAAWNDLRRVPALQAEGAWRNDPRLARRTVLAALRGLDGAAFYSLDGLVAAIKAGQPDFQRPDGVYTGWYLRDAASGRYLSGFESWDEVEGRLIRFLVLGPLFWLGALTLSVEPQAGHAGPPAMLLRLSPFGRAWLTGGVPHELPRPAPLTVGDDFVVNAPLRLPLLDRFRLLRFSEPALPKDLEGLADLRGLPNSPGPTQHRITRGSLARARRAGVKAEAIVQFLGHASGGRVPPRVVAALDRWDQHSGSVRVSRGAVLRVDDAGVLATLRADAILAPLLGDLLSAQAVLVNEANLPRVLHALEDLGYEVKTS